MPSIYEHKEQQVTETPLFLFVCELAGGQIERWCTHRVTVAGVVYEPRIVRHDVFEIQTSSDQGVDTIPRVSLTLANADSFASQIERQAGFKGAAVTVLFTFYNFDTDQAATDPVTLFRGFAGAPDEITESHLRLTASNRMSLQRVFLPEVRVQRRCPWEFPKDEAERIEAIDGGSESRYSRFNRCGYSADQAEGRGNLNGSEPFTDCRYTRSDCETRGMFSKDSANRVTARFGGMEFVPASTLVRTFGEKASKTSAVAENEARYNDTVPLIYGTGWMGPLVVFARNDGNLTRIEAVVSQGEIASVDRIVVNGIEIPAGQAGKDMTSTGWYNVVSLGNRSGGFNLDFRDQSGNPLGDPYGSVAYLSVVVPNRVSDGKAFPKIQALVRGLKLVSFDDEGSELGDVFSNNPAWVLLDLLRRCGWRLDEVDVPSFARAAAYCAEEISTTDVFGNAVTTQRFQCNLILRQRRSAADVLRGVRNGSRLFLTYNEASKLRVGVENAIELQQPVKPSWSNSTELLNGGWPAYEFGDGTNGTTGILRRANGSSSVRIWSRGAADTPNRFHVEFQDEFNEYQQDSLSVVDVADVQRTRQELTGSLFALGFPNFSQAGRILKYNLDRSVLGGTFIEFETTIKALGLQPGEIITVTYLKEGLQREPFRIIRIAPGMNFRTAKVVAQKHDDAWFLDSNGSESGGGVRRSTDAAAGLPRPLAGVTFDSDGQSQYGIEEGIRNQSDGGLEAFARVSYAVPDRNISAGLGIPLVSLAAEAQPGGSLKADQTLYYAVSAVDANGDQSALSFTVRVVVPPGADEYQVTLQQLRFGSGSVSFHVYRGSNPLQLYRIASGVTLASEFTDAGLSAGHEPPPDPNFNHANFYWRLEKYPEAVVAAATENTLTGALVDWDADQFVGSAVRVTFGKGVGQERFVASNTSAVLSLTRPWSVEPDSTSRFTIAEASWQTGASSATSPVEFLIPNRAGATIQIAGRAANAQGRESLDLSPVTRWQIGGGGSLPLDADVPPKPIFGLAVSARSPGTVSIATIAFTTLENTRTITSATTSIWHWSELEGQPESVVGYALSESDDVLIVSPNDFHQVGDVLQIDGEIVQVANIILAGSQFQISRGELGTSAALHSVGSYVYKLRRQTVVSAFPRDFFGSPASGAWSQEVALPHCRVAAGEMFVTNSHGESEVERLSLTGFTPYGLRTLSGGQYSFQIEGYLAIQTGAAPEIVVESPRVVRDVFAILKNAPSGPPGSSPVSIELKVDSQPYASLQIPINQTTSNAVNGFWLPPLQTESKLSIDITGVGETLPGSDLTVIIRMA